MSGNQALNVNYPGNVIDFAGGKADVAITVQGSDWYWAVCATMAASTLIFLGLAYTKPREHRLFHYITAGITMVASIAYFSMASNIGWAPITIEFQRGSPVVAGTTREIFYVRYIDWFITTPLLLTDLLLTAALPWPTILWAIFVDWIMIITGLVGALVASSYKWGYYTFGCLALLYIGYVLTWEGRKNASLMGDDIGKAFLTCGSLTVFLWFLYPVAWGLCEGGNVISSDGEAVFYGILDLLAKPVFGALLLFGHRNIDPERLGLNIEKYGVNANVGGLSNEKTSATRPRNTLRKNPPGPTNGTNGTTNGAARTNGNNDTVV